MEFSADAGTQYDTKLRSPSSPERQYCSSTTQPHLDSGMGHIEVRCVLNRILNVPNTTNILNRTD